MVAEVFGIGVSENARLQEISLAQSKRERMDINEANLYEMEMNICGIPFIFLLHL